MINPNSNVPPNCSRQLLYEPARSLFDLIALQRLVIFEALMHCPYSPTDVARLDPDQRAFFSFYRFVLERFPASVNARQPAVQLNSELHKAKLSLSVHRAVL